MIRRTVLENGVRLLSDEVLDMPSVTVGIWVESGSRDEEPEHNGISHFLEHLLFKGTERRTARRIAEEIDAVGGLLDAFTAKEYTCFYARTLGEHLPVALDLLLDLFLCSCFPAEEIERERSVICQEIAQIEDTPDDLIHDLFHRDFWGDHPLAWPISGTIASVSRFRRDDVLQHMQRHYHPARILVAMAGGARHEDLLDYAGAALSALRGHAEGRRRTPPVARSGVFFHEREFEQTHLCFGVPCVSQVDPAWYAACLLHTALGGGVSSRLFQEIRERYGLAYEVSSFLSAYHDAGYLGAYVATSAIQVPEVIRVVRATLHDLAQQGLMMEELQRAKAHAKASLLLGLETSEARMNRVAHDEIYFRQDIPIAEMSAHIERVTCEEIHQLATRCFTGPDRTLTIVGEAPALSEYQTWLEV